MGALATSQAAVRDSHVFQDRRWQNVAPHWTPATEKLLRPVKSLMLIIPHIVTNGMWILYRGLTLSKQLDNRNNKIERERDWKVKRAWIVSHHSHKITYKYSLYTQEAIILKVIKPGLIREMGLLEWMFLQDLCLQRPLVCLWSNISVLKM